MAPAQPDRYWSISFNTEASLLAGAVVGGGSDITSLYYNPAGISEIEEKKIILNTNLFRLDYERYNNILNKNNYVGDWGFRVQPRYVSYIYRSKVIRKLSWQFAAFNRDMDYKAFSSGTDNITNNGNREVESIDYLYEYNDYWGGIGASYEINEKLKIGLGLFVSIKNLFYNVYKYNELYTDSVEKGDVDMTYDSYERVTMYDVRMLSKIGIRYTPANSFTIGLNITTPSFKLFGNGDNKRKESITFNTDTNYSKTYEEYMPYRYAQIKDPFSVSFGFTYKLNDKSRIYASAEWFKGIESYKIIDGTKVIKSESENYQTGTDFTSLWFSTKSIINYAFGYKQKLSDNFDLMLGFRTDFNSFNDDINNNERCLVEVHNDLYHFTLGSSFKYKRIAFLMGLQYSTGQKSGYINNGYYWGIVKIPYIVDYSINSVGLYIGFTLNFL